MTSPGQAPHPPEPPEAAASASAERHAIVTRHKGLLGRALLVSGMTLLSRVLGMARETGCSALFGDSSRVLDALVTAWRVPNLFRRLLGEGALSTSLQTTMTAEDHERGLESGRALFLATLRLAALILIGVCAVMMALVALLPDLDPLFGSAWLGPDPAAVRELTLQLLPFVVFVCVSALMSGALQLRGEFLSSSLAPILLNLIWVGTMGYFVWSRSWLATDAAQRSREEQMHMARVLGWSALVAGVLQVVIQLPALRKRGLWLFGAKRKLEHAWSAAWAVFRQAGPLAFGAAIYQINVTVDGFMAQALLREGGPTAYNNATRIQQLPMGLLAVAATSSVFPLLRAHGHLKQLREMRDLHDRTQLGVLFLALPATLGLVVLATPISVVLFQHGSYGPDGVERIATALRVLALVVIPAGMQGLVTRCFYALGDFSFPVRVSIVALIANAALNTLFVVGFGFDGEGLAWGTVIASWLSVAWLTPGLHRRLGLPGVIEGFWSRAARMLLAAALAALAAWLVQRGWMSRSDAPALGRQVLGLCLAMAAAVGTYVLACHALQIPEWQHLWQQITKRFPRRA